MPRMLSRMYPPAIMMLNPSVIHKNTCKKKQVELCNQVLWNNDKISTWPVAFTDDFTADRSNSKYTKAFSVVGFSEMPLNPFRMANLNIYPKQPQSNSGGRS